MNQKELKTALKPIVKELIYECLITEGILSSVVSEVVRGTGNTIVETKQQTTAPQLKQPRPKLETDDEAIARRKKLEETLSGRLGVNVFEGIQPLSGGGREGDNTPSQASAANPLAGLDPSDSGVDISGLLKITGGWKRI
jgi:nucleotidyltransferase/DNA polymerase involved in DNA repair